MDRQPHDPVTAAEAKERLRGGRSYKKRLRDLRQRREGEAPPAGSPSLAEAKERVRTTAERARPAAWVGRHPFGALLSALAGGMVMGGAPRKIRRVLGRGVLGVLLRRM